MSDLVKRLRELETKLPTASDNWVGARELQLEAAALIEAQAERIKALEAGLKPFAEAAPYFEPEEQEGQVLDDDHMIADVITCGELRHAASLLEAKP